MAAIHYRMLNQSKGFSAQGLRALIDRDLYKEHMQAKLAETDNLEIIEGSVEDFIMSQNQKQIEGVLLRGGHIVVPGQIVLTTGTFLRGMVHIGR